MGFAAPLFIWLDKPEPKMEAGNQKISEICGLQVTQLPGKYLLF
jgi:hypothetical protein